MITINQVSLKADLKNGKCFLNGRFNIIYKTRTIYKTSTLQIDDISKQLIGYILNN